MSSPFFHLSFDELNHLRLKLYAIQHVNLLHASRAGYVYFGEIIANDVEPNEVEAFLSQSWSDLATDLVVTSSDFRFHAGPSNMNIAAMLICAWHTQSAAEWGAIQHDESFVSLADFGYVSLSNDRFVTCMGHGFYQ